MKIKAEHLEILRASIVPLDTPERRARYLAGDFKNAEAVKDLDRRYRWDLLWSFRTSAGYTKDGVSILDLYLYLNDVHMDTALRSLVPPLGKEAA